MVPGTTDQGLAPGAAFSTGEGAPKQEAGWEFLEEGPLKNKEARETLGIRDEGLESFC